MKATILFIVVLYLAPLHLLATGEYRSKQSGTWNATTTWEYFNGVSWINAVATPTYLDATITIQAGHTVTVTASVNVDQVTVQSGALVIHNNGTLKIMDGTGTDLVVNGTLELNASLTLDNNSSFSLFGLVNKYSGNFNINTGAKIYIENGGRFKKVGGGQDVGVNQWVVKNGGTYEHADDGTGIPNADWQTNSTCLVTGTINSTPGNLDQSFYHFTWNCPGETVRRNFNSNLQTILGNFTIISTGSGSIVLTGNGSQTLTVGGNYVHQGGMLALSQNGDWTMTVAGNFTQTAGSFLMTDGSTSAAQGNSILNVGGNFSVSNATFDATQHSGGNVANGITTLNLSGNFTIGAGALLTETATSTGKGIINFNGTGVQTFTKTGTISNTIDFNVLAGSTLAMGTSTATGSGSFAVNANAGVQLGSAQGITSSGASGNVQVTGTRTFSTSGFYTYNGIAGQVTGNGLPSTIKKLTINNASNVNASASTIVSDSLILSSGSLVTGASTITLGTGTGQIGGVSQVNGFINGKFRRWMNTTASSYLFPLENGGTNKSVNYVFTTAPTTGGTVTAQFIASDPGINGMPVYNNGYPIYNTYITGYWDMAAGNGLAGGMYSLENTLGGFTGISAPASLLIVSRTTSIAPWTLPGSNVSGTVVSGIPVAKRASLTSNSQFAIADGIGISLPLYIGSFSVVLNNNTVTLSWRSGATAGDYFDVERSADGVNFAAISRINYSVRNTYSYTDASPVSGKNYYRIRQIETSGKSVTSNVKTVEVDRGLSKDLAIQKTWPVPFRGSFQADVMSSRAGTMRADLYTVSGTRIYSTTVQAKAGVNTIQLQPPAYTAGSYVLTVTLNGSVQTRQLVGR